MIERDSAVIPEAQVCHSIPRRLRIAIPSKKGNITYFSKLSEKLLGCPGVEEVRVNPSTASVVAIYDCETKSLAEFACRNRLFSLRRSSPPPRTLFSSVAASFRAYNENLKKLTGGEIDIPSLVFVSLLISGIWQIARGNLAMPAWYTAFYYALGVFTSAKVDEFDEGENLLADFDDVQAD